MADRRERRDLLGQLVDQPGGVDHRVARDVVDRFLGIERVALAARRVERVDEVAAHAQHAGLEDREQADRAGADDDDVGMVLGVAHLTPLTVPNMAAGRARRKPATGPKKALA